MEKKESAFKQMDGWLFKQVDEFLKSPAHQKISDSMREVPEAQQKLISQIGHLLFVLLPVIIVLIGFFINFSKRSKLEDKNEALVVLKKYVAKKRELTSLGSKGVGEAFLANKALFQSRLTSALSGQGIDSGKFKIASAEDFPISGDITRAESTVNFNQVGVSDLMSALSVLQTREKLKIQSLQINKDVKTNLLNGNMKLVQIGKSGN